VYDIAIIGAGIHGSFLAANLVYRGLADSDRLVLIDPWGASLRLWRQNTERCGMRYLRSTSSHNMTDDFHALRSFARERGYSRSDFLQPYSRPALELFNHHADRILRETGVQDRIYRGRATVLEPHESGWLVHTGGDVIAAGIAILAFGRSEQLHVPAWARAPDVEQPDSESYRAVIRHIFSPARPPAEGLGPRARIVVVGAGVSGVQSALALAECIEEPVTLVTRHPITVAHFDSDPCFMGPRCLKDFLALSTAADRLAAIRAARSPGTIPWDVAESLDAAQHAGKVRIVQGEVLRATASDAGAELELRDSAERLRCDRVILATGFEPRPPSDGVVTATAEAAGLTLNAEGYPSLDRSLRWAKGLYVASALAELELGPMGPNIYGAHAASRRILPSLTGSEGTKRVLFPWNPVRRIDASA
jgi:uncharacterized NAD(P)/FAD-binding protein YdhS